MAIESIQILSLSDEVEEKIYSSQVNSIFPDVQLILSCGDLPFYYLEYVLDMLNVPMFFVHGNHDPAVEVRSNGDRKYPWGADNIHGKVVKYKDIILLGFEGSHRYSNGIYQYTQTEVWTQVLRTVPNLIWQRVRHGRFLDILVTHSPAFGLGDDEDLAHTGFKAYRWLMKVFKPRVHIHGHLHIYDRNDRKPIQFHQTKILNVSSFHKFEFPLGDNNG